MKLVEVDVEVLDEIRDAVGWYDGKQDGVGQRFGEAVAAALEGLPRRRLKPLRGFKHLGVTCVDIGEPWPYRILVVELPTTLWVVALAHGSRQRLLGSAPDALTSTAPLIPADAAPPLRPRPPL